MKKFSESPVFVIKSLTENYLLILNLAKRDIYGRYRGSAVGILWTLINPILMLSIYTFIFSIIFKARWSVEANSRADFALLLFAGLIIFNFFSECFNRAPSLILNNINYVKKIIFPLEILPWICVFSSLFHAFVNIFVWFIFYYFVHGFPSINAIFFPVVFFPLILFTMGISWFLSALAVYVRDTTQVTGMLTTILMFLSPIFYPVGALPEKYKFLVYLNPIAPSIEQMREVLFWGHLPEPSIYFYQVLICITVAWVGMIFFQKTRRGFADVL